MVAVRESVVGETEAAGDFAPAGGPRGLLPLVVLTLCASACESAVRNAVLMYFRSTAGLEISTITNVSAMQTALPALLTLPGGWLGDRFLGWRLTVIVGAVAIAAGTAMTAVGILPMIYVGVAVGAVGAGLMRGNALALLSEQYRPDSTHRLAAFTWFVWGSGLGSLLGGAAGALFSAWRLGIVAAALLLVIAVIAFATSLDSRSPADDERSLEAARERWPTATSTRAFVAIAGLITMVSSSVLVLRTDGNTVALLLLGLAALAVLLWRIVPPVWEPATGGRIWRTTLVWIVVGTIPFWVLFVALGSGVARLAESFNPGLVSARTAAMLQPISAVVLGPALAWWWTRRARQGRETRVSMVYALSFVCLAGAFVALAAAGPSTSLVALGAASICQAVGRLVIVPVGASAVTQFAMRGAQATVASGVSLATFVGLTLGSYLLGYPFSSLGETILSVAVALIIATVLVLGRDSVFAAGAAFRIRRPRVARFNFRPLRIAVLPIAAIGAGYAIWSAARVLLRVPGAAAAARATIVSRGAVDAYLPDDTMLGFVSIPPQIATIGIETATPFSSPDEMPSKAVPIAGFLIGKYEVTVAQYTACVADAACVQSDPRATGGPPDWPVRYVAWRDAIAYCRWLQKKLPAIAAARNATALTRALDNTPEVMLPSEAEWESAARFTSGAPYPWAGPLTALRANYASAGRTSPTVVGEFADGASALGLLDMSGNVAEWTLSEYRLYPYEPFDGREDLNRATVTRVIRGGSFHDGPTLVRTTSRQAADPARGYDFVGFRVVLLASRAPAAAK